METRHLVRRGNGRLWENSVGEEGESAKRENVVEEERFRSSFEEKTWMSDAGVGEEGESAEGKLVGG